MATCELGVTIARPVEDVFRVLSDVTNVPRWSPRTIGEELTTPGPSRVGSRRRAVITGFGGRTMVNEAEMIELEPNRRMVVAIRDAPVPVVIYIDFRPNDGGTRLDWTASFTPHGPAKLAAPLLALVYRWALQKDFDTLKTMMERGDL